MRHRRLTIDRTIATINLRQVAVYPFMVVVILNMERGEEDGLLPSRQDIA